MSTLPHLVAEIVGRYLRLLDEEAPGVVTAVYLVGSVALDDFRPGASDVDFLSVSARRPDRAELERLRRVHTRLAATNRRPFFDGSYGTWRDLRGDPATTEPSAHVHEHRFHDRGSSGDVVAWHEPA
jgi:hypothetical protein